MSCSRRDFLAAGGAGLVAAAWPRGAAPGDRIERIGVQLYTVRDVLAKDFEGTLARIAEIGYREVEFADRYYGRTAEAIRDVLRRNGLAAPAAHISIEALREQWTSTLDFAEAVGHRYLLVAWLDQADRSPDALGRVAELFNRAGEAARRRGIRFAYHNHDFEFAPVGGRVPYDVLLAETDPANVWFEMDLFWIAKGGRDPLEYFAKHPGRFPLVHVKDMAAGEQMVDVGRGAIDWRRIFAQRKQAGIEHYFVEHDQPADPFASIRASYRYLAQLTF